MKNSEPNVWMGNLTKQDIQDYAEREKEIKLGNIYSGNPRHKSEGERLARVFDGLLQLFGVEESNWQDRVEVMASTFTTAIGAIGEESFDKRDVRRWARGKKLGEYILDRAYWAVPIEGDEEQTGRFTLTLGLDADTFASIKSYGGQEVYRSYHDPETGDRVEGEAEDLEERAMKGELNTDIAAIHTDIAYSIIFSTKIPDPK
jgi:hypothetical protein